MAINGSQETGRRSTGVSYHGEETSKVVEYRGTEGVLFNQHSDGKGDVAFEGVAVLRLPLDELHSPASPLSTNVYSRLSSPEILPESGQSEYFLE